MIQCVDVEGAIFKFRDASASLKVLGSLVESARKTLCVHRTLLVLHTCLYIF